MKRSLSILLLWIFLFNVGGYYLFFWGLRYSANKELTREFDNANVRSTKVVEFKIPLKLPYPIYQNGYVRIDEEFEHKGEFYTLIQRRLENDTLYIRGVKNDKKRQLNEAFVDFAKNSNDTHNATHDTGNKLLGKIIKEYNSNIPPEAVSQKGWCRLMPDSIFARIPTDWEGEVATPPPDRLV